VGRIDNKPLDGNITGGEKLLGSDVGGATRNYELPSLAAYFLGQFNGLKNPSGTTYKGFLIISNENNLDTVRVQAGDLMIGANTTFSNGEVVIARVLNSDPTTPSDIDILINLQ
jgi:hypothetical protein